MADMAVNRTIERLLSDVSFFERVRLEGLEALRDCGLTVDEQAEIVAAANSDAAEGESLGYPTLRDVARFRPLFAALSASTTKVG